MNCFKYKDKEPIIAANTYIAAGSKIIGDVTIAAGVSVWFNAVIRGDVASVTVGDNSNVQDNATVHTAENYPCHIGKNVTIGHNAIIHGCDIEDDVMIGMGAIVLNGAKIERGAIVAAGTLVTERTTVKAGMLVAGVPGKELRSVKENEKVYIAKNAAEYRQLAQEYSDEKVKKQ